MMPTFSTVVTVIGLLALWDVVMLVLYLGLHDRPAGWQQLQRQLDALWERMNDEYGGNPPIK